jgi:DNA-binding transcriptional LysR family regulator
LVPEENEVDKLYDSELKIFNDNYWVVNNVSGFFNCSNNELTSVTLRETSLSSTRKYVKEKISDIAIINLPVENHPSSFFGHVKMLPVISSRHPLSRQKNINVNELVNTTQIVLRDLGRDENFQGENVGWLKTQRRLTVDNFDYAIDAVISGLGFCRIPEHLINKINNH